MANYYVVGDSVNLGTVELTGTDFAGYTVVHASDLSVDDTSYTVSDGSHVVIASSVDSDVLLEPASGEPAGFDLDITILENSHSFLVDMGTLASLSDPMTTVTVTGNAAGVSVGGSDGFAGLDLTVQRGAAIGDIAGSSHADTITIGDGAQVGNIDTGDDDDLITLGDDVTAKAITLGGTGGSSGSGDTLTGGSNVTINGGIAQDTGDNHARITLGDHTTVNGEITLKGGEDQLIIGNHSLVTGLVDTGSAVSSDDTDMLSIGNYVTLAGGFQTEEMGDTVSVGVGVSFGSGKADLHYDYQGNDRLTISIGDDPAEKTELLHALARAGFTDSDGDGVYEDNGLTYDFTWNGVTYTDVEEINYVVVCFGQGTQICTAQGEAAIEDLSEGDLVMTRDHGVQPIRWIGHRHLEEAVLAEHDNLRPIRIRAGALGAGVPDTDLLLSPQHRVLVRSKVAQRMFDAPEILVAAKQLLQIEGIDIARDLHGVTYYHMLFDRHEVVISNGAETESLYTGPEALKAVGPAARDEIFAIFPELQDHDYTPVAARPLASGRMGRKLAVRHAQNHKALVTGVGR